MQKTWHERVWGMSAVRVGPKRLRRTWNGNGAKIAAATGGLLVGAAALRSMVSRITDGKPTGPIVGGGGSMQLREFMTGSPHGIQIDDTSRHAAEQMRRHGFGAVPVFDQELLVGIVSDRDLAIGCMAAGHDAGACAVREHMTADPIAIDADATIGDALTKMADAQVRRLIVRGPDGVAGIVSLGDLAVRSDDPAMVGRALAQISQPVRQPLSS